MRRTDQLLMSSKADEDGQTSRNTSWRTIGPAKGEDCDIAARLEMISSSQVAMAANITLATRAHRREGALHSAF